MCVVLTGVIDAGIGVSQLNSVLSCVNVPALSDTTFKRHERIVGPKIEELANDSCVTAIRLEVEMTESAQ